MTGSTRPTTTASPSAATDGGCPSPRPPAPSRATTCGSPTSRRPSPDKPELITVQEGVDAQTSLHFGRDGLIYAYTNADAPRGRILVSEPGVWTLDEWRDLVPEDAEARSSRDGPSSTVTSSPTRSCWSCAATTPSDTSTATSCAPEPRPDRYRCPGSARSPASATAPKVGTRPGSATPTTRRLRRSTTTTHAPTRPRCGPAPRARSTSRR